MTQDPKTISNGSGSTVRAAINSTNERLATRGKGTARPSDISAGEVWIDENTPSTSKWTEAVYSGTTDIKMAEIDTTNNVYVPQVGGGTATIASAATTDLGSSFEADITVSGTTTITGFGSTAPKGVFKAVTFSGILTLTHNGTSLILRDGVNHITAAGDVFLFKHEGSGNWREVTRNVARIPGSVVQSVSASYATYSSHTTQIPADNSIPQNTEGSEILTVGITPKYSSSKLRITVSGFASVSTAAAVVSALFRDAGANAVHASFHTIPTAGFAANIAFSFEIDASSVSATTLKLRVGPALAATIYLNGDNSSRIFGGVAAWKMTVEEIAA